MAREGWLQQPASRQTKRFRRDPASWSQDPWVFVDSGLPLPTSRQRNQQQLSLAPAFCAMATDAEGASIVRSLQQEGAPCGGRLSTGL